MRIPQYIAFQNVSIWKKSWKTKKARVKIDIVLVGESRHPAIIFSESQHPTIYSCVPCIYQRSFLGSLSANHVFNVHTTLTKKKTTQVYSIFGNSKKLPALLVFINILHMKEVIVLPFGKNFEKNKDIWKVLFLKNTIYSIHFSSRSV